MPNFASSPFLERKAFKKGMMYALKDGKMMSVALNAKDRDAWFSFETIEKPNIAAPDWENEAVFGINKEQTIANYMPYASEAEMLADKEYYATARLLQGGL